MIVGAAGEEAILLKQLLLLLVNGTKATCLFMKTVKELSLLSNMETYTNNPKRLILFC